MAVEQRTDIVALDDPDASRIEVAGGKAARLARLLAAGFAVPEGFVLTTTAFERFVAANGLNQDSSPDAVTKCSLPDDVRQELHASLDWLGDAPLAVRSSGVAEDLASASYAGQYETVLDVRGTLAVERAILRCWASAFADRVQSYRDQHEEQGLPAMALLVQRLVPADSAGVAFTANPVTGDVAETLVSAVRGLGERLVSGAASPDEWSVRNGRAENRSRPETAVTADQVLAVAQLARRVETHFGFPQDVEWAIAGSDLYLLQARPITTLPEPRPHSELELPAPEAAASIPAADCGGCWLRRDQVPDGVFRLDQRWIGPVPPLYADFAVARHLNPGLRARSEVLSNPLPAAGYIVVDGYVYVGQPTPIESPTRQQWAAFEERVADLDPAEVVRRWWEEERPTVVAALRRILKQDVSALSDQDLRSHIALIDGRQAAAYRDHFVNGESGTKPILYRFAEFSRERLALTDAEILELLAGTSGASSQAATRLEGLAGEMINQPVLRAKLQDPDPWADPRIQELLRPVLDEYGYRIGNTYMVRSLAEEPARAVELLREAVARIESQQGGAAEIARQRAEVQITKLKDLLPNDASRAAFDGLLTQAQAAYGIKDDDKGMEMWGAGLMRRALLEAGRRLAERGILAEADLVWFVRREELQEALEDSPAADLALRAEARQAEFRRQCMAEPAPRLGTPVGPPALPPLSEAARRHLQAGAWFLDLNDGRVPESQDPTAFELHGLGVSRGSYRGIARVLRAVEELDNVQPGDVLVCPITSPSWTTVFARIGALVTDNGGILSHPAILAREFGIPAIVGTGVATKRVPDGALVEVDGQAGIVRWG